MQHELDMEMVRDGTPVRADTCLIAKVCCKGGRASAGIEVGGPGPGSFEIGGQALTTAKLITQLSNWALPYSI
jgi:hypothetical protein